MSEELIKRLAAAAREAELFCRGREAALLREAADALSRAPAVQVPEGWSVRPGLDDGSYVLVSPHGIKATFGPHGSMYAGMVAEFLAALWSSRATAPAPATVATEAVAQHAPYQATRYADT